MTLNISNQCVGKQYRARSGTIFSITGVDTAPKPNPVRARSSTGDVIHVSITGRYNPLSKFDSSLDLISPVFESLTLTKADIGRTFLNREGARYVLKAHNPSMAPWPFIAREEGKDYDMSYTGEGRWGTSTSSNDLVSRVEVPTGLTITDADIGRVFRNRAGELLRLSAVDITRERWPVIASRKGRGSDFFQLDGRWSADLTDHPKDLVERAPLVVTGLTITAEDIGRSFRTRDGKTTVISDYDATELPHYPVKVKNSDGILYSLSATGNFWKSGFEDCLDLVERLPAETPTLLNANSVGKIFTSRAGARYKIVEVTSGIHPYRAESLDLLVPEALRSGLTFTAKGEFVGPARSSSYDLIAEAQDEEDCPIPFLALLSMVSGMSRPTARV
jgi:hypothetical protein